MLSSLVRLVPYALGSGRSRFRLVSYVLSLVVAAVAAAVVPLVFRRVVDHGLAVHRPMVGLVWTLVALAVSVVAAAATAGAGWLGAWVGQDLTYRLRVDLYRHIGRQSVGFFAQSRSGALASRISGDAVDVQGLVQSVLGTIAGQGLTFVTAVVAMIILDPLATVIALAAAPVVSAPDPAVRPPASRGRPPAGRGPCARAAPTHRAAECRGRSSTHDLRHA